MAKSRKSSRKSRKGVIKTLTKTSEKALPIVNKGLKNVGAVAKTVAVKTAPVIEKGVSAVYETMATGFDLGIKGAKTVASEVKNVSGTKRRQQRGGRKTKRRRSHRRR